MSDDEDVTKYDFSDFIQNGKLNKNKLLAAATEAENSTAPTERAAHVYSTDIGPIKPNKTVVTDTHTVSEIDPKLWRGDNLHEFSKAMHGKQAELKQERERLRVEQEEIAGATSLQRELEYLNDGKSFKTLPNGQLQTTEDKSQEEVEAENENEQIDFDNIDLSEVEIKLRILLKGHKEVVHIIGEGGATLTNIRSVSEAKVRIDNPTDYEHIKQDLLVDKAELKKCCERILTLSGNQEQINTALELITAAIDAGKNKMIGKKRTNNPVVLKLIFPTHMCGVILGKQGTTARKLREETGAKLEIENELLKNSTERLVRCSGDAEQSSEVVQKIVDLLLMSTIQRAKKEQQSGRPMKEIETTPYEPQILDKYLKKSKKEQKKSKRDESYDEKMAALQLAYTLAQANGIPPPTMRGLQERIVSFNKKNVMVMEYNVGAIIGPNGARIKRIRTLSNASVRILDPIEDEPKRTIEIQGNHNEVSMATYLLNCCNDLYGDTELGNMNNPFTKNPDGSFKTQLGEWLTTTNQTPEEQLVLKSFFADVEQKQNFKHQGHNSKSYSGSAAHQPHNEPQASSSKFLPGMKGYQPNVPSPLTKNNKYRKRKAQEESHNAGTAIGPNGEQLQVDDYLEKNKRQKKSKKSKKAKREKERVRSNREILEELQREHLQPRISEDIGNYDLGDEEVNQEISLARSRSQGKPKREKPKPVDMPSTSEIIGDMFGD